MNKVYNEPEFKFVGTDGQGMAFLASSMGVALPTFKKTTSTW